MHDKYIRNRHNNFYQKKLIVLPFFYWHFWLFTLHLDKCDSDKYLTPGITNIALPHVKNLVLYHLDRLIYIIGYRVVNSSLFTFKPKFKFLDTALLRKDCWIFPFWQFWFRLEYLYFSKKFIHHKIKNLKSYPLLVQVSKQSLLYLQCPY